MIVFKNIGWEPEVLREILPDLDTALFFASVFELDYNELSMLLELVFQQHSGDVLRALLNGQHSTELQDYVVDVVPTHVVDVQDVVWSADPELGLNTDLVALFRNAVVPVASTLKQVGQAVGSVLDQFPSIVGQLTFEHLAKWDTRRSSVGQYKAVMKHSRDRNLLIVDDSGSMTSETIRTLASDFVALAFELNATLALVSNSCRVFQPGTATVQGILDMMETGGTHYETLVPLFKQQWANVLCVADYDSSLSAKEVFRRETPKGIVGQVFDISLVTRPTFLGEVVAQASNNPVQTVLVSKGVI